MEEFDISKAVTVEVTREDAITHLVRVLRDELSMARGSIERMEAQVLPLLEDNNNLREGMTKAQNSQFSLGSEMALAQMEKLSVYFGGQTITTKTGHTVSYEDLCDQVRRQVQDYLQIKGVS